MEEVITLPSFESDDDSNGGKFTVHKLPYAKLNSIIPIEVSFESMVNKIEGNYITATKLDNFTYEVYLKVKEVVVINATACQTFRSDCQYVLTGRTAKSGQIITKKYIPTW